MKRYLDGKLGLTDFVRAGGFGQATATKNVVFSGNTVDGVGDFNGTGDPIPLFTVTGSVVVKVVAVCQVNLVHAASAAIEVGITSDPATIIATTNLTTQELIAKEIWHDNTPDKEIEALAVIKEFIITDGNDIEMDTTTANVNTGTLEFYCMWTPLSSDGKVVAA